MKLTWKCLELVTISPVNCNWHITLSIVATYLWIIALFTQGLEWPWQTGGFRFRCFSPYRKEADNNSLNKCQVRGIRSIFSLRWIVTQHYSPLVSEGNRLLSRDVTWRDNIRSARAIFWLEQTNPKPRSIKSAGKVAWSEPKSPLFWFVKRSSTILLYPEKNARSRVNGPIILLSLLWCHCPRTASKPGYRPKFIREDQGM